MLEWIKETGEERGHIAQDGFSKTVEWKNCSEELESLNTVFHGQGQEEELLQGQLRSLQDRIAVEEKCKI
eukprot:10008304-Prorocentrum_lima.AAC.1